MPVHDQERIVRLFSELHKAIGRLEALAKLPLDQFEADPDKVGSTKYHFIVAIESCIDICSHLIARNGFRAPEDYGDTFTVMVEEGILDSQFALRLRNMAKFRNRLVHLYWEIDNRRIHDILRTRIVNFRTFLGTIASFLGDTSG